MVALRRCGLRRDEMERLVMTMREDPLSAKLLASLKRHNPSRVRAYAGDDDARDIAVPTRRRRWSVVIEAIEARSWTRIEMLDKSGAVLGYVENVEPAREMEDLGDGGRIARTRSEAEWIVALVIKAQRDAMTFRDAEVSNLLRAQGDVVRELTSAMHGLSAIYRAQVDAASDVAAMNAEVAHGGNGQMKELLEAAPVIVQMLPVLKSMMKGGS